MADSKKTEGEAPKRTPLQTRDIGTVTAPASAKVGSSEFERGQPAPKTLYLVMDENGVEEKVSDKQPERGHVLIFEGDIVDAHITDAISKYA